MDQSMQLGEVPDMANGSAQQESNGEQFVREVANSGVVPKIKVDKYGVLSSNSTILSQELRFSDKGIGTNRLDNFEANNIQEIIPLLEQSEMISNADTENNISFLQNDVVGHLEEGVKMVSRVDNRMNDAAMENSVIGINGTSSSENAKLDNTENVIIGKGSLENLEVIAAECGNGCETEVHVCHQCGKGFMTIDSLNGHTGKHRREEYKQIRKRQQQYIPVETTHTTDVLPPRSHVTEMRELKKIWGASQALIKISMPSGWKPAHGAKAIDVSADKTCSSTDISEDTTQMMELADLFITMAQTVTEDTVRMPSRPGVGHFLCTTCNKTFDSYQALGGHKSSHNKPKNNQLEDTAGSSSGSSERCTWKYMCCKCNERFPTGQSLGGHKRKHLKEYKMTPLADGNVKPPVPLPHDTMQWSGPVVLVNDNVQSTGTELMVADETVHLPVPLAYDAVQQAQKVNKLVNETELPSGAAEILVADAADEIPPPVGRHVFDLNKLPPEANDRELEL